MTRETDPRGTAPPTTVASLQLAKDADRNPDDSELSIYLASSEPSGLAAYREAGVARAIFGMPSQDERRPLGRLDELAGVMKSVD